MKPTPYLTTNTIGLAVAVIIIGAMSMMPTTAFAIDFPAIPGVTGKDPITVMVQLGAFIFKAAIYFLFVAAFAVGAYVAISTLLQIVKDRDNAADMVGKLLAAVAVVVICYWFLSEGEKAADELSKVKISAIETAPDQSVVPLV